jgi:AmiR/NasT family two-component response regulator
LLEANAHAVISKPFRPTGVLSTLVLARSVHGYEQRLLNKVNKLEETLRSRRVIERAVKLLAERRSINDVEAYDHIRRQATNKRVSIVEVASMIINASDVLDGMGPINR